jgi:predicted O-methyltransferase YrrM
MNRYWSHIHHFVNAKKRHGIHSPFVYQLSDECLSVPWDQSDQALLKNQFKKLNQNQQIIRITDFGAGSKHMGNERKISDIFKNSRSSKRYAQLLYQLSRFYQPKRILELGTSLAWGTLHLHLGHPQSIIDTIEGCPQTNAVSQNLFPLETNNINFHNARFEDYFQSLNEEKYDLIFIDGNHRGLALLSYIEQLTPYAHNGTLWILDDIRWSDDMWDAWEKIVENPQFHLSIDFGRMALVSYRKQQEKEHFMLRL